MPSSNGEKASVKSIRSSFPSDKSIEQAPSVHDQAPDIEDLEKDPALAIAPTASLRPTFSRNATSINTTGTNNPDFEVDWDDGNDQLNPRNWPVWYKGMTIGFISWSTWCVVVYSTSYTTGLAEMQTDFHISSEPLVTLGVTTYCKHQDSNYRLSETEV